MRYMIIVRATRGVAEIEVRPFFELEDFEQGEAIERFRDLEATRQ